MSPAGCSAWLPGSRQLIVGPDAATCALVASALVPLAPGNGELYLSLSVALAALTGVFCILASFIRLGALADFLSKPILVGFLNGISLHILAGQLGKLAVAGRYQEIMAWCKAHALEDDDILYFPTMHKAVKAFVERQAGGGAGEVCSVNDHFYTRSNRSPRPAQAARQGGIVNNAQDLGLLVDWPSGETDLPPPFSGAHKKARTCRASYFNIV